MRKQGTMRSRGAYNEWWERQFWLRVPFSECSDRQCWEWKGYVGPNGYGRLIWCHRHDRKMLHAHRVAYELMVGPIPDGLQIDHLCRNRRCVNPNHLEPVTAHTNVVVRGLGLSAENAAKKFCKRGHTSLMLETPASNRMDREGAGHVAVSLSRISGDCSIKLGRSLDFHGVSTSLNMATPS